MFQYNRSTIYSITSNFQSVDLIQSLHIDSIYLHIKTSMNESWKDEFKEKITKRYSNANPNEYNCFLLIQELKKEINSILPHYDIDIIKFCDNVLYDLREKEISNKREFLASELSESSKLHLAYIENVINKKQFWESDQENIVWSHELFLKNEYLSIIQYSFPEAIFSDLYENCIDILKEQTSIGVNDINSFFRPFRLKLLRKYGHNCADPDEHIHKGTNYKMKETEHTKKIKIMIETDGDLKDFIPQDF